MYSSHQTTVSYDVIPMSQTTTRSFSPDNPRLWIIVPAIAFAGIILGLVFSGVPILSNTGIFACMIAAFVLGALALRKPRRDIVALLVPVFAVIIFNPWGEFNTGPAVQILFAGTLIVVGWRLEKRFSSTSPSN
ncbi:MAG TPA: hypothetical protein ENN44_06140 [Methanoculleus sp.]|nr:hypothetical protein [Methanoculleus sp.]